MRERTPTAVGNAWPIRNDILAVLHDHPFLSRRQIELLLGSPERTVRQGLRELKARKRVWQTNARQPCMHARCLYAPTKAGSEALARQSTTPLAEYCSRAGFSEARLDRLVLTIERVFQLRTFFLWLASGKSESWRWRAIQWDVEVGKLFSAKGRAAWIPFHGAALMQRGPDGRPERGSSALLRGNQMVSEANPSSQFRQAKSKDGPGKAQAKEAKSQDGRWAFVVVEFDLSRVPVESERERLQQFVAAQDDPRYWGKDTEYFFPVLLVIAQDELRLQDYYNVLRSAALSRQLPMPRAYLTTFGAMLSLRSDNARPIWYSTISGQRTSLLSDIEGIAAPFPEQAPWRRMPLHQIGGVGVVADTQKFGVSLAPPPFGSAGVGAELTDSVEIPFKSTHALAQIALNLTPLEKRLLDEIAAHPLLTRKGLVLLLQASLRRVRPALAKLTNLKLVEVHRQAARGTTESTNDENPADDDRQDRDGYLIAPKGQRYLAHTAGFGSAVRRYARARGWGKAPTLSKAKGRRRLPDLESSHAGETQASERSRGFDLLIRHGEHTAAENDFFLHLAKVARDWGHTLTWLSELESRLYYEAAQRRHSFLPDGRGSYIAGKARYEFAVEIDRSRTSQERVQRKLAEYEACISLNVLRSEGIELLRLLILTSSWERAETWRRAAQSVRVRFPIFIATFDRLHASHADAPIWLQGDVRSSEPATSSPKVHCFECFSNQK
jgi:hypothetical protein